MAHPSYYTQPWQRGPARAQAKPGQADQWRKDHPVHCAWVDKAAAQGNEFAKSLQHSIERYGYLTDRQMAAVSSSITREDMTVIQAANAPNIAGAGLEKLEQMFAKAKKQGLKKPRLRIGDLTFMPAPSMGRNPGAIYVQGKRDYLGKIVGGKFLPNSAGQAFIQQVVQIATDPLAAAVANGKQNGWCACCGKELTDPMSVKAGIGPVCAKKFFDLGA